MEMPNKYLSGEVLQRFHAAGDIYITTGDGKTVGHVGPGSNEMTTQCQQEEADTRMVLHIVHALNCGASNVLVKTSDSDVVILIHHLRRSFDTIKPDCSITVNYGTGQTQRLINIRELADVFGCQSSAALPLFVSLTGCDSTSAMKVRSKRICFNAWTKCSAHVTAVMVELMDRPFQQLKMDEKFAALEELFTKIYGGGAPSINEMRKLIICQRNQNVEMLPPSQNALFQHCRRVMFQASTWATAHDATVIEPDAT